MKQIPDNILLGQKGINLIESIVIDMGFLWTQSGPIEAGIDGTIETRDSATGEVHNSIIQVQSKALSEFACETDRSFEYICKQQDLEYWLRGNVPVILIVSRPETREAYWVSVKSYFSDLFLRKARKIKFDKSRDRFSKDSREALARIALSKDVGVYLSPQRKSEILYSNLLRVEEFAPTIYIADTPLRNRWEVHQLHKSRDMKVGSEWELWEQKIVSLHDLDGEAWEYVCDPGTVESFDSSEWAYSEETDLRNIFVALLNRALRRMLYHRYLEWDDNREYFYFKATPELTPWEVSYCSLQKKATRAVFQPYPRKLEEGQKPKYYRHSAFAPKFKLFDGHWHLEVTPTYRFTRDGYRPDRFAEERLKGIKRLEKNAAILGQVIMWAYFLAQEPDLFTWRYPFLRFGKLASFELDRGICDSKWLPCEDDGGAGWTNNEGEELSLF